MNIFWLFRSNIAGFEYYHKYDNLKDFEENCHDFYMLLPIWMLRNNIIKTAVVWRLGKIPVKDIDFIVDGKLYSQRWVSNLSDVYKYPKPDISLFRGGFKEYDKVVSQNPQHFGKKLYLGTGKRIYPQYGGKYDVYLQEDPNDFKAGYNCMPFYKTASPEIFRPLDVDKKYDICWPCNFTQIKQKGQRDFIKAVGQSEYLKSLKIVHCGNKPGVGKKICESHGVKNIEFLGQVDRTTLNHVLNQSKFGLCMSNRVDGCPRIATEILMSGTPLIVRDLTRLLEYYKKNGVIEVNEKNLTKKIKGGLEEYDDYERQVLYAIKHSISFDDICRKNIVRWQKI